MKTQFAVLLIPSFLLLSACHGGGGDDSPATAPLSVRITDAPANAADIDRVCLAIGGITVHYAGGEDVVLDYDPLPSQVRSETHCIPEGTTWDRDMTPDVPAVKMNALGGSLTVALVDSLQVPQGRITWIRLHLVPGGSYLAENGGAEYAMADDSMAPNSLRCPSCEVTDNNQGRGFKLNRTFEVTSDGLAVTIDLDLGVSLHEDVNGYVLRPTARIERDDMVGTITGAVDDVLIGDNGGVLFNGGTNPDTGCAVYVFREDNMGNVTLDDFHADSLVITTARVRMVDARYAYAAGALPEGTYTVAFTCDQDDPLTDETDVNFPASRSGVRVTAGQTTSMVDLPEP
jgi:hypothetical protein